LIFVDSHCHLNLIENDLTDVINRAIDSGIRKMVVPGTDLQSSIKAIEIAETFESVYAAVGIHPHESSNASPKDIQEISRLATHPKVVAIGEIGLDYHYSPFDEQIQKTVLLSMLTLASNLGKPVILHSRNALSDLLTVVTGWQNSQEFGGLHQISSGGVFHMFEGDSIDALQAIRLGFYISIGGNITFKNNQRGQELIKAIGLQNLLLETDTPFISPHPFRGTQNEPARIPIIAAKVADLLQTRVELVAGITTLNANTLFKLGL
jgi:TatD DNase family protein